MKSEQIKRRFMDELQHLLVKWGAELTAEDHWEGYPECGEDVRMTVTVPAIYDADHNCLREFTVIDLGSYAAAARGGEAVSTSTQVPQDHPLMRAWNAHKTTPEYANSKSWAQHAEHVEGSLWALFMAGWTAAQGCGCQPGTCESKPAGCRMAEEVKPGSCAQ